VKGDQDGDEVQNKRAFPEYLPLTSIFVIFSPIYVVIHFKAYDLITTMDFLFLKKLWYCVGGGVKQIFGSIK